MNMFGSLFFGSLMKIIQKCLKKIIDFFLCPQRQKQKEVDESKSYNKKD